MALFSDILLTVDFDRTLTAPDSTIPQSNLDAIQYFIDNGGAFTINTGRSIPMAKAFIGKVPVSAPLLLYNGSAAYDVKTGQFTQLYPIALDKAQVAADMARLFPDLLLEFQAVDAHYLCKENRDWEIFSENGGCAWGYAKPEDVPGPFLKFALYGDTSGHSVSSMYDASAAELKRMRQVMAALHDLYGDKVEVFYPCAKIIDIHAKGVSKLQAARDLQKHLGRKILVCAGDGENDIPMLAGADHAFTPADSVVADRFPNVCPCGEGAVAEVILKKIPEILAKEP